MSLARSRLRMRRAELMRGHGPLNLIPLVDILTAIVFFSLLSVVTFRSALAGFDLLQPRAADDPKAAASAAATTASQIVVRVDRNRLVVRHSGGEATIARSPNGRDADLTTLHRTLADLVRALGASADITVVPSDDVLYDDLVRVLDEVHRVKPHAVALGTRARQ